MNVGLNGMTWLFAADMPEFAEIDLPSDARWLLGIVILLYLCALFGLSVFATGKVKTEEDYLVAGRSLPLWLAWGTLIATWFGAATMSGAAQAARDEGLMGVILDPIACSATLIFAGLFFAGPMWRLKLLTCGDLYRRTYGGTAETIGAAIQVPAYFGWIAAQYTALGQMQHIYFGIPLHWAILIACLVTLGYTLIGGMWSVTLTDTLQILIAFFGLIVLALSTYAVVGNGSAWDGFQRIISETAEKTPDHLYLWPVSAGFGAWMVYLGTWATGLFGNIPGQDLQQRVFASNSPRTGQLACIFAGVLYLGFGLIPVTLGFASRITDPGEISGGILPLLAGKYLNKYMAVVFVIAFTSIVVSTATSAVLAPATLLGHNLLGKLKFFKGHGLILERSCVFLVSMGGLVLAYTGQSIMELLDLALSLQLVALFIPLSMAIYGRPKSPVSGIAAMVAGAVVFFVYFGTEYYFTGVVESQGLDLTWDAYLVQQVPMLAGLMPIITFLPSDLWGFLTSILAYNLCQLIYAKQAPINDHIRAEAWETPAATPTIS
ncbi:sodium:solute symporter [bacterium]|nr:sodium:solute symporter [bacterium]